MDNIKKQCSSCCCLKEPNSFIKNDKVMKNCIKCREYKKAQGKKYRDKVKAESVRIAKLYEIRCIENAKIRQLRMSAF